MRQDGLISALLDFSEAALHRTQGPGRRTVGHPGLDQGDLEPEQLQNWEMMMLAFGTDYSKDK